MKDSAHRRRCKSAGFGVSDKRQRNNHIRNNPEQPVIVIDDVVYEDDNDILTMIQTSDMSRALVLDGNFRLRGSAGAIVITLKDGKSPGKTGTGHYYMYSIGI